MQLRDGCRDQLVSDATEAQGCIPCHETLRGPQAVCRGFFDRHATAPLQIADRLGLLKFTDPARTVSEALARVPTKSAKRFRGLQVKPERSAG